MSETNRDRETETLGVFESQNGQFPINVTRDELIALLKYNPILSRISPGIINTYFKDIVPAIRVALGKLGKDTTIKFPVNVTSDRLTPEDNKYIKVKKSQIKVTEEKRLNTESPKKQAA